MAFIEKSQNRIVRIEGQGKRLDGRDIKVYDAQTGEQLQNIYRITVRIYGRGNNEAAIIYHKLEAPNRLAELAREDAEESVIVQNIEISGTILLESIDERDCDVLGFDEAVKRMPDMTELPKEQE